MKLDQNNENQVVLCGLNKVAESKKKNRKDEGKLQEQLSAFRNFGGFEYGKRET